MRTAQIERNTLETQIKGKINLDGDKNANISTGIGFFDHMLHLLAFHGNFDLDIQATGDTYIDSHHTMEDVGILLGNLIKDALGDRKGITRYGHFYVPMDEALARSVIDISSRPFLVYNVDLSNDKLGNCELENFEEFFRALAFNAGITLHVEVLYGKNDHHKIEALFKSFARALKAAIEVKGNDVSSSKGVL